MSWETVVVVGSPIIALIVPFLVYLRSRRVDATSERMGVVTENRAGQAQISEGQQDFITMLQEDNRILRAEFAELKIEVIALRKEVNRLHRKYGDNGNGTPPKGTPKIG